MQVVLEEIIMSGEILDLNASPPVVGILAGGKSTRMGTDKTLLKISGMSLLERAVVTALKTGYEVAVSGCGQPEEWPFPDVSFVQDTIPHQGPIHGIMKLLERYDRPVIAIGSDMPLITVALLNWLIEQVPEHLQEDGLATVDSRETIQPLLSIYNPDLLGQIDINFGKGRFSAVETIERGRFGMVTIPTEMESLLFSVDTPDDFVYVQGILTKQDVY